jgi:4-amino-4-deoxy-L-arabinose transferase-like glycosyltransferase
MVEGDGVEYALLARQVAIGEFLGLANAYWSNLWVGIMAATSLLTGLDVVGAGRLASLLTGVLLVGATAFLGARLFGRATGVLAGLGVAVHPWLIQFSTLVFTESCFSFLLVAVLLAGWGMIESPRLARGAATGALAGAAFWMRPEAYGLITVIVIFFVGAAWSRRAMRQASATLAVFLALVAALVLARALLIHRYSEEWDFGQLKGVANLIMGLAEEKQRASSSITPEGENSLEVQAHQWTVLGFVRAYPGLVVRHVGGNLLELAACAKQVFPPWPVTMGREAFPEWVGIAFDVAALAGLGLAALGLGQGLRGPGTRGAAAFLGAVALVHLAGLAPLYVHARMIVVLTPVFLVLFAHGLVVAGGALLRRPLALRKGAVFHVILAFLSVYGLLRAPWFDYASEPVVQRDAGLWLREHFPQSTRMAGFLPFVRFYFYDAENQDNGLVAPWGEYPVLLAFARRERVDVIAAPEWQLEGGGYPTAQQLTPEGAHPGMAYLTTIGEDPYRMHLFRVEPPAEMNPRGP